MRQFGTVDGPGKARPRAPAFPPQLESNPYCSSTDPIPNIFPQHTTISRQFRARLITLFSCSSSQQIAACDEEVLHGQAKGIWGLCTLWPLFQHFWRETHIKQAQECPTVPNLLLRTVCRKVMNYVWSEGASTHKNEQRITRSARYQRMLHNTHKNINNAQQKPSGNSGFGPNSDRLGWYKYDQSSIWTIRQQSLIFSQWPSEQCCKTCNLMGIP